MDSAWRHWAEQWGNEEDELEHETVERWLKEHPEPPEPV